MTDHHVETAADLNTYLLVLIEEASTVDTPEAIAARLEDLDRLQTTLKDGIAILRRHAADVLKGHGVKHADAPSGRRLKLGTGWKRRGWDKDELKKRAVRFATERRLMNQSTGEAVETEAEAAVRILSDLLSLGDGKVRGLEAYQLDPDEFCESERGEATTEWA